MRRFHCQTSVIPLAVHVHTHAHGWVCAGVHDCACVGMHMCMCMCVSVYVYMCAYLCGRLGRSIMPRSVMVNAGGEYFLDHFKEEIFVLLAI